MGHRDTLFSLTQNALEMAIVADVNVITDDFLSLNLEGMMVTEDIFYAFMVDDPDGINNSGCRINELSALLSRSGISIFYVSTRITDFILVKEKRLKSVLPAIRSIFSLSVDSDCDISTNSRGDFTSESEQGSYPGSSFTSMNSFLHTPSTPSRGLNTHLHFPNSISQNEFNNSPTNYRSQPQQIPIQYGDGINSSYSRHSVGISIPFGRRSSSSNSLSGQRGFFSSIGRIRTDSDSSAEHQRRKGSYTDSSFGDGIGRYFPKRRGLASFSSIDSIESPISPTMDTNMFNTAGLPVREARISTNATSESKQFPPFTPLTPLASSFPAFGSLNSLGLLQESVEEQEDREFKIKEQVRKQCPRSVIDDKLMMAGLAPDFQTEWGVTLIKVLFYPDQIPGFTRDVNSRFISFTTTDEGTSLIADQEVLAQFGEHMLNRSSSETILRCIQVDLSTFGLDTCGLVYSMSNPLVDHGINLLCMSTYRTANVLVHDADLEKSLEILSSSG
ncbi:GATS protein-like 3 [Entomortierella beljakovae]|nr:GATS protein-like 3 [Entomortierella beljakovae]